MHKRSENAYYQPLIIKTTDHKIAGACISWSLNCCITSVLSAWKYAGYGQNTLYPPVKICRAWEC